MFFPFKQKLRAKTVRFKQLLTNASGACPSAAAMIQCFRKCLLCLYGGEQNMTTRKFLIVILILCLVFSAAFTTSSFALSDVCFIAVNEVIDQSSTAYISGSTVYLPYWIFTNYNLGLSYTHFSGDSTIMLFSDEKTVFFNYKDGTAYDEFDTKLNAKAVMRGSVVYLPLSFICQHFGELGLSWSYFIGDGFGDLVRLKTQDVILDDTTFKNASPSAMQARYLKHLAANPPPSPSPSAAATPSLSPGVSEPEPGELRLTVAFSGLPDDALLAVLKRHNINAYFFLSAEDVFSDPDMVRRLVCEGHMLGALCSENVQEDFEKISALIMEAAMTKIVLFTAPDSSDNYESETLELTALYKKADLAISPGYSFAYYKSIIGIFDSRCFIIIPCYDEAGSFVSAMVQGAESERYVLSPLRES